MPSIAEMAYARAVLAAESEGRLAVADDDLDIAAEVAVMDARLRLADERIARRAPETIDDLRAQFELFAELVEWDDGPAERLYRTILAALDRLADCDLCRGVIQDNPVP